MRTQVVDLIHAVCFRNRPLTQIVFWQMGFRSRVGQRAFKCIDLNAPPRFPCLKAQVRKVQIGGHNYFHWYCIVMYLLLSGFLDDKAHIFPAEGKSVMSLMQFEKWLHHWSASCIQEIKIKWCVDCTAMLNAHLLHSYSTGRGIATHCHSPPCSLPQPVYIPFSFATVPSFPTCFPSQFSIVCSNLWRTISTQCLTCRGRKTEVFESPLDTWVNPAPAISHTGTRAHTQSRPGGLKVGPTHQTKGLGPFSLGRKVM